MDASSARSACSAPCTTASATVRLPPAPRSRWAAAPARSSRSRWAARIRPSARPSMPLTRSSAVRTGRRASISALPGDRQVPASSSRISVVGSVSSSSRVLGLGEPLLQLGQPRRVPVAGLLGRPRRSWPAARLVAGGLGRGVELGQPLGRRGDALVGLALPGPDLVERALRRVDPGLRGLHAGLRLGRPAPGRPPRPAARAARPRRPPPAPRRSARRSPRPRRGRRPPRRARRAPGAPRCRPPEPPLAAIGAPTRSPRPGDGPQLGALPRPRSVAVVSRHDQHAGQQVLDGGGRDSSAGTRDQVDGPLGAGRPRTGPPGSRAPSAATTRTALARRPRRGAARRRLDRGVQRLDGDGLGGRAEHGGDGHLGARP